MKGDMDSKIVEPVVRRESPDVYRALPFEFASTGEPTYEIVQLGATFSSRQVIIVVSPIVVDEPETPRADCLSTTADLAD